MRAAAQMASMSRSQGLEACGEPVVFAVEEHEFEGPGEVVQVLAGMEQVHDLGGLGEFRGGYVPDPGRTVAEDGHLADVAGAAADAFGLHQAGEHGGGLERGHIAGGVPVRDRVALAVELILGEEDGELDLAGAGPAVFALPAGPAVSLAVTGTPVPSIAA